MKNAYSLPSGFGVWSDSSISQIHLCITALLSIVMSKSGSPKHLYSRFITFIEINCNKDSKEFLQVYSSFRDDLNNLIFKSMFHMLMSPPESIIFTVPRTTQGDLHLVVHGW